MEDHALAAAKIERRRRKDYIVLGCAILVFVPVIYVVWEIVIAIQAYYPRTASMARVSRVASAFVWCRAAHDGKSPQNLSDLFPEYIKTTETFGLRPVVAQEVDRMAGGQTRQDLIDAFSTCRLLALPDGRAVLLEPVSVAKSEQVVYVILDSYRPDAKAEQPHVHIETWEVFTQRAARQFAEPAAPTR
jgi:hypothetical protein